MQLTLRQKYSDPRLAAFMAEAPSSSGPLTVVGSEVAETLWAPDTFARQDTGLAVEKTVRDTGAVPATIAVIDGILRIGLDEPALSALSIARDVRKLSRADLAATLVEKATGSTTVAATMIAAKLAGIEVFTFFPDLLLGAGVTLVGAFGE